MKKDKIINFYNYITALLGIFPLLKLNYISIFIIFWAIFSLFIAIKYKLKFNKEELLNIIVLSSLFIAYLLFLPFVKDKNEILVWINRSLPFLIFPIFLILNKKKVNQKTLDWSLLIFAYTNTIISIKVWLKIYFLGFDNLQKENNFYDPVFRNIFSDTTSIHLPYLGILFTFSIYIFFIRLLKEKNIYKKLIYILSIIILLISLIMFAARMALLCLFLSIILFLIIRLKTKKIYKISIIVGLILCSFVITKINSLNERIKEAILTEYVLPHKGQTPEEFQVRYGIYNCTKQILKKDWLFGVGPTEVQKTLNNCYSQYNYEAYNDYKHIIYNSHCQYSDIILKFGIFGLLIFFISIFWGINNNNYYYFGFILIFSLSIITENMLSRQIGVVFFTFFNSLFFINKIKS